jgi:hypothetical protein
MFLESNNNDITTVLYFISLLNSHLILNSIFSALVLLEV